LPPRDILIVFAGVLVVELNHFRHYRLFGGAHICSLSSGPLWGRGGSVPTAH